MEKLISRASEVIKRLESEGRVTTLSFHKSSDLDHKLALEFKKIKDEFELKERNSRVAVKAIEIAYLNQ